MKKTTTPQERIFWIEREITGTTYEKEYGLNWIINDLGRNWKETTLEKGEFITKRKYGKLSFPEGNILSKDHHIKKEFIEKHFHDDPNPNNSETEFKKLKSRWSSNKKRKSQKSISISLDAETHKKLKKLKGKHNLNKTITALIDAAHQQNTTHRILPSKNLTIPTLDFLKYEPNILNIESEVTEGIYKINLDTINEIYRKSIIHDERLFELAQELKNLIEKINKKFNLN